MADSDSDKPRGSIVLWALSAVFVLALLIGAGIVTVNALRDDAAPPPTTPPTAPPTTAPTAGPTSSPPEAELACERPESGDIPQETPDGIEWRATDYGLLLPYSAASGPSNGEAVPGCFEHSPTGAVLAMSHIIGPALLDPSRPDREAVIDAGFTPSDREAVKEQILAANNNPWQWRAFRISSYSSEQASIAGIYQTIDGARTVGLIFELRWEDGDWKIDSTAMTNPQGFEVSEAELTSYIPWQGRS